MSSISKINNIPSKIKKILVIEDMENLRTQMISDLVSIGFKREQIIEAASLSESVKQIKFHKPDFIISDWNLPDGIGFDLLKKIKATPSLVHIPFVLCTTMDDIQNILQAINEGASEYIVKPWTIEELVNKLSIVFAKMK